MIRPLLTAIAATFSITACAGPIMTTPATTPEGLVVLSLTADAPAGARISSLEYRIRPVEAMGEGEQLARTERRAGSVTDQFRRAAADNARRTADNLRSRVDVLGGNAPDNAAIHAADKTTGRVLVLHLPPGEYELRDWSLSMADKAGNARLSAPAGSAYRFTVAGGEQRYVGNVHLSVKPDSRFSQSVLDARERDLSMAGALDETVKTETVVYLPARRMP